MHRYNKCSTTSSCHRVPPQTGHEVTCLGAHHEPMSELDTILETLAHHRGFLLHTAAGLSDDDARRRPTASALSVGGIVKHVATVETQWIDFLERGPEVMA